MFLTEAELTELTGKRQNAARVRALNTLGVQHKIRPRRLGYSKWVMTGILALLSISAHAETDLVLLWKAGISGTRPVQGKRLTSPIWISGAHPQRTR